MRVAYCVNVYWAFIRFGSFLQQRTYYDNGKFGGPRRARASHCQASQRATNHFLGSATHAACQFTVVVLLSLCLVERHVTL
jgi:hypothetical protein